MKSRAISCSILLGAALASGAALACGEGQFNMGQGLRYQGYLAPRPATVLVYSGAGDSTAGRDALVNGLRKSGHQVTAVAGAEDLANALRSQRYDVLIASYADIDAVAASTQAAGSRPALLPVVDRKLRKSPGLRERFANFVLSGASLGQYLKSIDNSLPVAAR